MAYNIIRPRRGIKSMWEQFKGRIYKQGEMLVESPETGVGTGPVNIKFGDGVSSYENLPYAIEAPTDELIEGGTAPMTSGAGYLLKQELEDISLPETMPPSEHDQSASTITAGTFAGTVVAPASTAYTTAQVRNGVIVSTKPTAGASASYPNGTIVFVKKG